MEPPAQQVGADLSDGAPSLQAFSGPSHGRDGAPERSGRSRGRRRPERARRRGRDPARPNASPGEPVLKYPLGAGYFANGVECDHPRSNWNRRLGRRRSNRRGLGSSGVIVGPLGRAPARNCPWEGRSRLARERVRGRSKSCAFGSPTATRDPYPRRRSRCCPTRGSPTGMPEEPKSSGTPLSLLGLG